MSSNRSSTTDKQNCPTLLKALSHFTAFGILSSTPQNHYQNKLTCCPLRMDWTRINEAHQRAALCSKSTGVNTHSSASGTSCGEVTQTGTHVSCCGDLYSRSTTTAPRLSAKNRKPVLQPDPPCRLTPLRFPAFSYLVQPLTSTKG